MRKCGKQCKTWVIPLWQNERFFIYSYFSEDQEEAAEFLQLQGQEANVEPCITEIIRNHRRIKLQTTEIHCLVTYVNISLQRISKQKLSLRVMVCTVCM